MQAKTLKFSDINLLWRGSQSSHGSPLLYRDQTPEPGTEMRRQNGKRRWITQNFSFNCCLCNYLRPAGGNCGQKRFWLAPYFSAGSPISGQVDSLNPAGFRNRSPHLGPQPQLATTNPNVPLEHTTPSFSLSEAQRRRHFFFFLK